MLTLFSIPKAFTGHVGTIQRNALRSWTRLKGCECLLFGDDAGVREAAAEMGARWLPITRNELGTPLLDAAFRAARETAKHPMLCYVNGDIVLMSDLLAAVSAVRPPDFLMAGQRWNLDVHELIDFDNPDWERHLRDRAHREGTLYPPYGIDYFVFARDSVLGELPAFAVGRPKWDNWLIYNARNRGIPVVDATQAVMVVHQNHDYAHVKQRTGPTWEGTEGDRNLALAGGEDRLLGLQDATHVLRGGVVVRAWDREHLRRRLSMAPVLHPWLRPLWRVARGLKHRVWRAGSS